MLPRRNFVRLPSATRSRCISARFRPCWPFPLVLGVLLLSGPMTCAQMPQNPGETGKPSGEVLALFDMIDDIDWLRNLNPLKLKSEQITRMIAAITTVKTDYDKKAAALATTRVVKVAEEIRATKKKVLAGGEIAGVLGVYLSIPVMASLRIVWRRWRMYAEKKRFGPLNEYSFLTETTPQK